MPPPRKTLKARTVSRNQALEPYEPTQHSWMKDSNKSSLERFTINVGRLITTADQTISTTAENNSFSGRIMAFVLVFMLLFLPLWSSYQRLLKPALKSKLSLERVLLGK